MLASGVPSTTGPRVAITIPAAPTAMTRTRTPSISIGKRGVIRRRSRGPGWANEGTRPDCEVDPVSPTGLDFDGEVAATASHGGRFSLSSDRSSQSGMNRCASTEQNQHGYPNAKHSNQRRNPQEFRPHRDFLTIRHSIPSADHLARLASVTSRTDRHRLRERTCRSGSQRSWSQSRQTPPKDQPRPE